MGTGRATKYKKEFDAQARVACSKRFTDADLAELFGVVESTLYLWKKEHTSFSEAISEGKVIADEMVERSLFEKATGYTCKDTKFATFEGQITDSQEYDRNYPPDTTAAIFWLKNRKPKDWRDKTEVESTSKVQIVPDFGDDDGEEL